MAGFYNKCFALRGHAVAVNAVIGRSDGEASAGIRAELVNQDATVHRRLDIDSQCQTNIFHILNILKQYLVPNAMRISSPLPVQLPEC